MEETFTPPHNSTKNPKLPYCKTADCWSWKMTGSDFCALHHPKCECYRYVPDTDTRYADIMTGGDGEGWMVTQDCPIHKKGAKEVVVL